MRSVVVIAPTSARRQALVSALESTDASLEVWSADVADLTLTDADDLFVVDGVERARRVARTVGRSARLLVLESDVAAIDRLLELPVTAWGVIPARATTAQIVAAAHAVDTGLVVVSALSGSSRDVRGIARRAMDGSVELQSLDVDVHDDATAEAGGNESLTRREREVLDLLVQGLSNRRLADVLGISEHTVKFHVASIYGKLGASSRAELVRRALRRGLVAL